jgi:hypothetical protein
MDKNKYAYLDGSLKIIEWDLFFKVFGTRLKKFLLIKKQYGSFSYRWYDNVKRY